MAEPAEEPTLLTLLNMNEPKPITDNDLPTLQNEWSTHLQVSGVSMSENWTAYDKLVEPCKVYALFIKADFGQSSPIGVLLNAEDLVVGRCHIAF